MKKPTILIVEDEKLLSDAYEIVLTKSDYNTIKAYDGMAALKIIKSKKIDLMLLDLRMPRLDGLELLEKLDIKTKAKIKIIVFSNYDVQKDIDKAFALGADRYMLKAWASPKELVKVIDETLKI